jgi:hypothetical protein
LVKRAQRKQLIKTILRDRDWDQLKILFDGRRSPDRHVLSALFDPDPLLQWRAIEAHAIFAGHLAESDLEDVRRIIRKALWLMNDESGGILWNGPELIAAILREVPSLLDEYGRILASFLVEEPFERGTHWALTHLAPLNQALFSQPDVIQNLHNSLTDSDPATRAYALRILHMLGDENLVDAARRMQNDDADFTEYDFDAGQLLRRTVSETATRFLDNETHVLNNQPIHIDMEVADG